MQNNQKEMLLKQIGTNLKKIRIEKGIDVKVLASNLNITHQALHKIESGQTDLNISRIVDLSLALDANYTQVLNLENNSAYTYNQNNGNGNFIQNSTGIFLGNETEKEAIINKLEEVLSTIKKFNV
ncbi:MAG: Helix-turn-helix domain [Bacteroidota bacterium]|jgi:transcriptional regulator with XRE-family HTH domain